MTSLELFKEKHEIKVLIEMKHKQTRMINLLFDVVWREGLMGHVGPTG
jgi:hypothetical protein